MDAASIDAAADELVEWGILERADARLALTRRFRGALARAAGQLQESDTSAPVAGAEAMRRAAALALVQFPRPPASALRAEHATLIAAVELASLPDAVREVLGA